MKACSKCGIELTPDVAPTYKTKKRQCLSCINDYRRKNRASWSRERREQQNKDNRKRQKERKERVFSYYGEICNICGFDDLRALSIDHINGNGYEHRKETGLGSAFYLWLIRNDFPDGFQTLCMNCQWIKRDENNECGGRKDVATIINEAASAANPK